LVRVQEYVKTADGYEPQDIPHIDPAYLRWSPGDGGDVSANFRTAATLDVAIIESWAQPVFQLLTADERLRSTYRLNYEMTGPRLTFEVAAESGGCIEKLFALDGSSVVSAEEEPMVQWRTTYA